MRKVTIILGLGFLLFSCNNGNNMQQSWQPKTPKLQQSNTYKRKK